MKRTLLALALLAAWQAPASSEMLPGFEPIGKDNKKAGLPTNQYGDEICILAGSVSEFWECRTEAVLSWVSDLVTQQQRASKEYSNAIKNCNKIKIIKDRSACIDNAANILRANSRDTRNDVSTFVADMVEDIQVFYGSPKAKKAAQAAARNSLRPNGGSGGPAPDKWPGTNPDPNAGPNQ